MANDVQLLTDLPPKKQRFVHLYLTGQYKIPELAEILEITPSTARIWLKQHVIQDYIETFKQEEHEAVENALKNLRQRALGRLGELMESQVDAVALQATKDVLDRTGHKAVQKIEKDVTITTYEQQLTELVSGIQMPVIDVECKECD